jgi:hypothetical protein
VNRRRDHARFVPQPYVILAGIEALEISEKFHHEYRAERPATPHRFTQ